MLDAQLRVQRLWRIVNSEYGVNSKNFISKIFPLLAASAMNPLLRIYRERIPMMLGELLGFGGNCVAETLVLFALMKDADIKFPKEFQLAVYSSSTHIELGVLETTGSYYNFDSPRKPVVRAERTLFTPEVVYLSVLSEKNLRSLMKRDPNLVRSLHLEKPSIVDWILGLRLFAME